MIDCLYTGPATDSIDCCMELEPAWTWYWRLFMSSVPRNLYITAKAPQRKCDPMGKLITDHLFRRVEALEKRIEELEGRLRVEFSKIDPVYILKCHKPVKKSWKGKSRGTENPSSAEFRRLPNAPEKE